MSKCRDLARLTKKYSNQQIQLLRALEDDPAQYLALWFQFHRTEYDMSSLVVWAPRRMARTSRLLALSKAEMNRVVQEVGANAAAICFYIDSGNEALLDLVHNEYVDLSSINHYHVLHFALHYKKERCFRKLLEYGYSPLVLNTPLLRIAIERHYCLQFLFQPHWNYRLQKTCHFAFERVRPALQPIEHKRLDAALHQYCISTYGMEPNPLALALLWTGKQRSRLFDENVMHIIKKFMW